MSPPEPPMDTPSTPKRRANWRGTRTGRPAEAKRRWQRDPASVAAQSERGGRIPLALRLGIAFLAAIVCLVVYLALILSRPLQIPFIALTAPTYAAPLPPNGWSDEDVQGLAALDGETITLYDARGTGRSRSAILESLQSRLDAAAESNPHGPIVFYFNLHAAVDGRGRPCLVPPRASAVDSSTWLPVEDIFATIASRTQPPRSATLVVFDANRLGVEWQLGMPRNTFVERLGALVQAADGPGRRIPSLAVLTSADVDEVSHTSRELGGSVFGHFLRLGLAGRADQIDLHGNGDSQVDLRELHAYLATSVSDWCRRNRDASQSPVLLANDSVNFPITWVYRTSLPDRAAPSPTVPAADIAALWLRAERLERLVPIRYAPLGWSEVRRTLHYLEQAANAGGGYAATARATAEDLDARLATFERQAASGDLDRWNVFRPDDGLARTRVPARSLALRRAFGRNDGASIAAWDAVVGDLATARLTTLAGEIDLPEDGPMDEAHFLRLLAGSPAALAEPGRLGRVVALHRLGEKAAAPDDERVWPWISEQVVRGDAARRLVEDALMANDAENASAYATANAAYEQAIATGKSVAAAFQLLNSVQADLIPLARWLTDPRHQRSTDQRSDRNAELVNATLLPLIEEAGRLARDLRDVSGETANGWETRTASVRTYYDQLRTELDRTYGRLLEKPESTAAMLREIDLVLSIPRLPTSSRESLTPAQQRAVLAQRRAEIAVDLATTVEPADEAATATSEPLRQIAVRWQMHPLAAILTGGLPEGTAVPQSIVDPQDAERLGQITRSRLSGLSLAAQTALGRPATPADDDPAPDDEGPSSGDGSGRRRLVDELRIAAPLQEFVAASSPGPIATLTDLNVAELLIGQAERKLADFWGPAVPGGSPFFLAAADDLEAARALAGFDHDVTTRIAKVRQFLELRRLAAESGLQVQVADVLLTSSSAAATAAVAVRPGSDRSSAAIPEGTAAVVAGRPGRWELATPEPLAVPTADEGVEVDLTLTTAASESPNMARVGVLYRGHLFDAPLMASDPTGPTVEFTPPDRAPTTLTVRSSQRQGLSVVFVLDCSASMAAGEPSEGFGQSSTRLDLARESLSRMLAELATRPNTRVGVVFYGHRVGWRKVESEDGQSRFQRSVQRDYARSIPDAVMPYNDIEVVEPLGRFDGAVAGEVETALESLRPWGETPLYLAIDEALRQFSNADASAERSVIVITDGLNEQSNPSAAARKTPADVLATWERNQAAIEIIGFGVSAGDSGRAADEFGRLAEATGGRYESATRATDLIAALERRIGPGTYRVRPADGGDGVSTPIGQPVDLAELAAIPSEFIVSIDGRTSQVRAEGGEALDLIAGETGPILSARYSAGSPQFVPLVSGDPSERSGHLLGLHRPLRTSEGGVTFEFSLQHEDQTFHARPKSLWIEVTPTATNASTATPYFYFHDRFVTRTPVPVIRWTAANWPADAAKARVQFWCRETVAKPVAVMSIAELLDARAGKAVPNLDNVAFEAYAVDEADGVRVDLIERHTGESEHIGRLAVTCTGPILPRQYIHRFDADHGVVLHALRFDAAEFDAVLDQLSLVIVTRESIERDGLRLDTPAVIDVSGRSDLVVPFRSPYAAQPAPVADAAPMDEEARPANPVLVAPGNQ